MKLRLWSMMWIKVVSVQWDDFTKHFSIALKELITVAIVAVV